MKCSSSGRWWSLMNYLGLGILALAFSACDPMQTLIIENTTEADAQVRFIFQEGTRLDHFQEFAPTDTLTIQLGTADSNRRYEYHFGLGHWRVLQQLDSLSAMLNAIEIQSIQGKTVYQGEKEINQFLENSLEGSSDEALYIKVE